MHKLLLILVKDFSSFPGGLETVSIKVFVQKDVCIVLLRCRSAFDLNGVFIRVKGLHDSLFIFNGL